jgi:hypothetical protein
VNKAKELEVAVAERMKIVAAARKAFADKCELNPSIHLHTQWQDFN